MRDVVTRVKRRLSPSFALLEKHLELVCRNTGCGGGGVFFRRERMKDALGGDPLMERPHSDFGHCEFDLVASPSFEESMKEFCSLMRSCEEGKRRCLACDRHATRRVASGKRTHAYICHAGLMDSMTPVVVQGACVGLISVGMALRDGHSPSSFEGVWKRIADIPGLDRERMQKAYWRLTRLSDAAFESLMSQIEATAQTVAGLWENIVSLAAQERQLARAQLYRERDFAEMLLCGSVAPQDELLERARSIGLRGLPTAVIVIQIDPTDREVLSLTVERHRALFLELMELLHEIPRDLPDALPASVVPSEAVLLLHIPETRNAHLRTLLLKEAADTVRAWIRSRLRAPVLVGVGPDYGNPARLPESYREARHALWLGSLPDGWRPREPKEDEDRFLGQLAEIVDNLEDALDAADREPAAHSFERALRVIATVGERAADLRRVLFTRLVENYLERLTRHGADPRAIEPIRLRYIYDFPFLQTLDDMASWIRSHLLQVVESSGLQAAPDGQVVREVCRLIENRLDAPLPRAEAAASVGISDSTLGRLFQERLGLSYREYVLRVRMAHAQRALVDPRKSVSEVAHDVGYSYTSAFTRAFVGVCGVSPREYRASPRSYPRVHVPGPTA